VYQLFVLGPIAKYSAARETKQQNHAETKNETAIKKGNPTFFDGTIYRFLDN
jgi:hypothetical protein